MLYIKFCKLKDVGSETLSQLLTTNSRVWSRSEMKESEICRNALKQK